MAGSMGGNGLGPEPRVQRQAEAREQRASVKGCVWVPGVF